MDKCNTKKKYSHNCIRTVKQWFTDCQTMVYGLSNIGLRTVKQWFTDCQRMVYGL